MSAVVGDGSVVVWDSAAVPVGCPESVEREIRHTSLISCSGHFIRTSGTSFCANR